MSTFIFNCPSCSVKHSTFDIKGFNRKPNINCIYWEFYGVCRACENGCSIIAEMESRLLNEMSYKYGRHGLVAETEIFINKMVTSGISLNNDIIQNLKYDPILPVSEQPPEYLPPNIKKFFLEATKCLSIGCHNASGAMFRLCLDSVTKEILEKNENLSPSSSDKKTIHSRLNWIFMNGILPANLESLSRNIKDDGNDAAHDGALNKEEAEDLLDFTYILLEQVFTIPKQVELAMLRRTDRRQSKN
ncbi:DUF4145 domain-containing protein [Acinetobacter vivianii]|uniref:DUF4145 domain-containing protein n=1 Tax=Acinetobacter vivianii TaxID=1776742 RepID=UPI000F87733C|nr:DUF4145 domain-containing protein [Acinetobacter baumannii]